MHKNAACCAAISMRMCLNERKKYARKAERKTEASKITNKNVLNKNVLNTQLRIQQKYDKISKYGEKMAAFSAKNM